ncbi:MAG TPA: hypothetical protein DCL54_08935 [Alphaproteobacteria bacterium]|nr:hypothetical protein [Alphaproteobacteria bacterium]
MVQKNGVPLVASSCPQETDSSARRRLTRLSSGVNGARYLSVGPHGAPAAAAARAIGLYLTSVAVGRMEGLVTQNQRFDLVDCPWVLAQADDPRTLLQEMVAVAAHRGLIWASVPDPGHWLTGRLSRQKVQAALPYVVTVFDRASLANLGRAAGLQVRVERGRQGMLYLTGRKV